MRTALIPIAFALLVALPASADPQVCDSEPCIEQDASAGTGGVDASVTVHIFMGNAVGVHAGPDAVLVGYGAGITRCTAGVDLDPIDPVYYCVF